jgi:hypothetical protein
MQNGEKSLGARRKMLAKKYHVTSASPSITSKQIHPVFSPAQLLAGVKVCFTTVCLLLSERTSNRIDIQWTEKNATIVRKKCFNKKRLEIS